MCLLKEQYDQGTSSGVVVKLFEAKHYWQACTLSIKPEESCYSVSRTLYDLRTTQWTTLASK
jgi:hypothetical protein